MDELGNCCIAIVGGQTLSLHPPWGPARGRQVQMQRVSLVPAHVPGQCSSKAEPQRVGVAWGPAALAPAEGWGPSSRLEARGAKAERGQGLSQALGRLASQPAGSGQPLCSLEGPTVLSFRVTQGKAGSGTGVSRRLDTCQSSYGTWLCQVPAARLLPISPAMSPRGVSAPLEPHRAA